MAVKPQDILNRLTKEDRKRADELEEYIDFELTHRFKGDTVYIDIYRCNNQVFQELKRRYTGWNIKMISGEYQSIEFSPSAVNDDVR
jgi:hypothetical protein